MKDQAKKNAPKAEPVKHSAPKPPHQDGVVSIELQHLLTPLAILFSGFMISIVLFFGLRDLTVNTDSKTTNSGSGSTTTTDTTTGTDGTVFTDATISIDDDPYKGDKDKAKIAIVEFTDFQCPYCQRNFQQTYPEVIKNYVDSGKAIYVLRDYPLSFHEHAHAAAVGGNCALDMGGNDKFFEYHDKIFETTLSTADQITKVAQDIGLDMDKFKDCLASDKFDDEIDKDMTDGSSAGISGTPGFVIGKLDKDGNVTGKLIPGAYPYSTFEEIAGEYL